MKNDDLAKMTTADDTADTSKVPSLAIELQGVYNDVPSTCCANSGECCVLTDKEMEEDYATMFPLYRAEYVNIVEYVRDNFSQERQDELFSFTEERPRQCPFLGEDNRCGIYPVRPLICRTYAVMDLGTIEEAAQRHQGEVPDSWIHAFVRREGGMICPRVMVTEPAKLLRHARNLVTMAYERALTRLSRKVELATGERKKLIRLVIRRRDWPVRWTWGGFNTLRFAPVEWLRGQLPEYWRKSKLSDPG